MLIYTAFMGLLMYVPFQPFDFNPGEAAANVLDQSGKVAQGGMASQPAAAAKGLNRPGRSAAGETQLGDQSALSANPAEAMQPVTSVSGTVLPPPGSTDETLTNAFQIPPPPAMVAAAEPSVPTSSPSPAFAAPPLSSFALNGNNRRSNPDD